MKSFLVLLLIFSNSVFAKGKGVLQVDKAKSRPQSGLVQETSFDLGIGFAPSFAPEIGYDRTKLRLGIEFGISLYKYKEPILNKQKPRTSFKLVRFGIGSIDNKPVALFSPIQVYLKDKLYLSPTFGFGKDPYTVFSITYELLP